MMTIITFFILIIWHWDIFWRHFILNNYNPLILRATNQKNCYHIYPSIVNNEKNREHEILKHVDSFKLQYLVGLTGLIDKVVSKSARATIYRNLYENTGPDAVTVTQKRDVL